MKNYIKAEVATVCVIATLMSGVSVAEEKVNSGFYPSLSAIHISDDNIYRTATSKVSDSVLIVSPGLLIVKAIGKHRFTMEYKGDYASYDTNLSEDYSDHFLTFDGLFDFSRAFQVNFAADYNQNHETRDTAGFIATAPTTVPNTFTENGSSAGFTYGRRSAKAQLEMDFATKNMVYTNNNQEARDRKSNVISTSLYFNIGHKSSIFVEAKQNTIDYVNTGVRNLDSKEAFSYLGLRWDVSDKITSKVKLGSFTKTFDSASETDGSGSSYEASIIWKPKTYSHVSFTVTQTPKETTTTDSFFNSSQMAMDWQHNFSYRLGIKLNLSSGTDEYSAGTRIDTLSNVGLELNYKFSRSVDFGLNYSSSSRDSSLDAADYSDGLFMLTAKWTKL